MNSEPRETDTDGREPLLRCVSVDVSFGQTQVLHSVNLVVEEGEIHVLVGPNGAGKTTLANAITGHAPVTSGLITLAGKALTGPSWRRARQGIGRKFQVPRVFPRLSRDDNLAVAFRRAAPRERTTNGSTSRWAQELSHGERQQLELDMVHATRPRLVVLDEPTAGMPTEDRQALAQLIRSRRDGSRTTYLIVEHDLHFVSLVADRVSFLQDGRLTLTGTYEQISTHPDVISAYLGEPLDGERR